MPTESTIRSTDSGRGRVEFFVPRHVWRDQRVLGGFVLLATLCGLGATLWVLGQPGRAFGIFEAGALSMFAGLIGFSYWILSAIPEDWDAPILVLDERELSGTTMGGNPVAFSDVVDARMLRGKGHIFLIEIVLTDRAAAAHERGGVWTRSLTRPGEPNPVRRLRFTDHLSVTEQINAMNLIRERAGLKREPH